MDAIRRRLKSKTYWTAIIMAILTGVETQSGFFTGFLDPALRPWTLMAWPLAMLALREMTKVALADK